MFRLILAVGDPGQSDNVQFHFPSKVSHVNDSQEISLQHQREQEGETSSAGVRYGSSLLKLCVLSTGTVGKAAEKDLGIKMVQMLSIVSVNYSCPCASTFLCLAVQKWDSAQE